MLDQQAQRRIALSYSSELPDSMLIEAVLNGGMPVHRSGRMPGAVDALRPLFPRVPPSASTSAPAPRPPSSPRCPS